MFMTRFRKELRLRKRLSSMVIMVLMLVSLYCIHESQRFSDTSGEVARIASGNAETAAANGVRYDADDFDLQISALRDSADHYRSAYSLFLTLQLVSSALVLTFGPAARSRIEPP